jgi:hypothetical protein
MNGSPSKVRTCVANLRGISDSAYETDSSRLVGVSGLPNDRRVSRLRGLAGVAAWAASSFANSVETGGGERYHLRGAETRDCLSVMVTRVKHQTFSDRFFRRLDHHRLKHFCLNEVTLPISVCTVRRTNEWYTATSLTSYYTDRIPLSLAYLSSSNTTLYIVSISKLAGVVFWPWFNQIHLNPE